MATRGRQAAPVVHARFNAAIASHWRSSGLKVGVAEAGPDDESSHDAFMAFAVGAALDYAGASGLGPVVGRLLARNVSEQEIRKRVEFFTVLSSVLALDMQRRWDPYTWTQLRLVIPADKLTPVQLRDRVTTLIEYAYGLQDIAPRAPFETKLRPLIVLPHFTFASSIAYERALSVLWITEPHSTFSLDYCADPEAAEQNLTPWPLIMGSDLPANPDVMAARAAFEGDYSGSDITAFPIGIDLRKRRASSTVMPREELDTVFHLYDTVTRAESSS